MYNILIVASIGIVFILSLRTKKEKETIPVFRYEEETNINGDTTDYLKECWEAENNERKNGKSFDTY
jgi:hypothetical protein